METTTSISSSPSSSTLTTGDEANTNPAAASPTASEEEDYESWTWKQKFEDLISSDPGRNIMPKHPYYAALFKEKLEDVFTEYLSNVSPKLRPAYEIDSVKEFYGVCSRFSPLTGLGGFLYPEILSNMASYNALRCARAALEGAGPLSGRRADPNRRHRYGFTPLHRAAENFSVDMVKLLFRHGASANIRTRRRDVVQGLLGLGGGVVEGLLPLHVAVENASMHKYLEDHWADGDHIANLIVLLCLPEMKMFLDTTRLIAKQTDNIVDEVWNYIDNKEKLVEAAILLLAAQKQLRGCLSKSTSQVGFDIVKSCIDEALDTLHLEVSAMVQEGKNGRALKRLKDKKEALLTERALIGTVNKTGEAGALLKLKEHEVSLNGFDIVKSRIDDALNALHLEGLTMIKEGENGKALRMLKDKKEALLTAHALVGIIQKAGEALDGYIQTCSEVSHEEVVEHVSSILTSNGVVLPGKGIDIGKLEWFRFNWVNFHSYQYSAILFSGLSGSQRGDTEETNEADKSSSLEDKMSKRIPVRRPPKGLALKEVRNMFFPYWKSVLNSRSLVKMFPTCQLSRKDLLHAEASKKGTKKSTGNRKSIGNIGSIGWSQLASNYESRRKLCAVASLSRKVLFKRP